MTFSLQFIIQSEDSLNDSLILFTGQKGQSGMGSDHLSLGILRGKTHHRIKHTSRM